MLVYFNRFPQEVGRCQQGDDVLLDFFGRHGKEFRREYRERQVVMGTNILPVQADHLEDAAADTIAFDGGLSHLLANHHGDPTILAVLVLAKLQEQGAVANRLAITK